MSLELSGKIIEKHDTQVINDTYNKRTFVIQPEGERDKPVQFEIFGKIDNGDKPQKVLMIDRFNIGDDVKVMFSLSSNFWEQGQKWFTKADAFGVFPVNQGQMSGPAPAPYQSQTPQIQQPTKTHQPVMPSFESMDGSEEVPF